MTAALSMGAAMAQLRSWQRLLQEVTCASGTYELQALQAAARRSCASLQQLRLCWPVSILQGGAWLFCHKLVDLGTIFQ